MPAKALGSTPAYSWGSAHMLAHCSGPRRRSNTHGGLCLKPVRCCLQAAAEVDEASAPAEEPAKQEVESKAAVPAQTQQVEAGQEGRQWQAGDQHCCACRAPAQVTGLCRG